MDLDLCTVLEHGGLFLLDYMAPEDLARLAAAHPRRLAPLCNAHIRTSPMGELREAIREGLNAALGVGVLLFNGFPDAPPARLNPRNPRFPRAGEPGAPVGDTGFAARTSNRGKTMRKPLTFSVFRTAEKVVPGVRGSPVMMWRVRAFHHHTSRIDVDLRFISPDSLNDVFSIQIAIHFPSFNLIHIQINHRHILTQNIFMAMSLKAALFDCFDHDCMTRLFAVLDMIDIDRYPHYVFPNAMYFDTYVF